MFGQQTRGVYVPELSYGSMKVGIGLNIYKEIK